MTRAPAQGVKRVACVGTGTIGSGWAATFLAHGLEVFAADPAPGAEARLILNIDDAWPKLEALGLGDSANRERLRFTDDIAEAVREAEFVQESATEDEALKVELLARVDAACSPDTVIASSSSQFLPSRIAAGCRHPERVIVGHPFVPTYLIPLVEVVGGDDTDPAVLDWAKAFYRAAGKRPLVLKKEIEGYIANRLQRAVFAEAMALVDDGICAWGDVEDAVTWGPGFRWAVLGPLLHRHLGGGKGGVRHMIEHFGWSGTPGGEVDFIEAVEQRCGGVPVAELESWRDDKLIAMLHALTEHPQAPARIGTQAPARIRTQAPASARDSDADS